MMVYDADTDFEVRMLDGDEIMTWVDMELDEDEVFDGTDIADDLPERAYAKACW